MLLQERNLLSVAYKNVVGARRSSWRVSVERNKLIFSALLVLNPFIKNCSSMLSHALLRLFLPSSRRLREARRSSNLRRSTGRRQVLLVAFTNIKRSQSALVPLHPDPIWELGPGLLLKVSWFTIRVQESLSMTYNKGDPNPFQDFIDQ